MRTYQYRARNMAGRVIEGTIHAGSDNDAYQLLEADGLLPIKIGIATEKKVNRHQGIFGPKVKNEDIIVFTRQLSTMLRAGVPILQAMEALKRQTANEALKQILEDVTRRITGGSRLSEALAEFPGVFSSQYVSIVVSGESGADLVQALLRIADWMERELEIRRSIISAISYPLTVIGAMIVAATIMIIWVIPQFARMYAKSAVALPLPTRMLVAGNDWLQSYWPILIGVIISASVTFFFLLKVPSFRLAFDKQKFNFPVTGVLYGKIIISRFARIFAMLVKNGVPVLRALEIAPGAVANTHLIRSAERARKEIEDGSSIFDGFSNMTVFPPIMTSLIGVGEKTGTLDEMLDYVVDQYDMEIQYELKVFSKMVETIITVVIGVAVLFLALAIFMPMWNMSKLV
ncbi:type II secretion system F family protein [Verrucomicrobiota bacterium]